MTLEDPTERTQIIERVGALDELGVRTRALGQRALVVTDPGLVASGHVSRAIDLLRGAGVTVLCFDAVREDPTSEDVAACATFARAFGPDVCIGLGGGSSIDVAKGANLVLCAGGDVSDYEGRGDGTHQLLPLVAVPTTAGTGSEAQSFALIAEPLSHRKMACGDPGLAPRVALLDPELTLTLPSVTTACTGLDAIGHALESAVTRTGNAISTGLAVESFALSSRAFPRVLAQPEDLEARADMLRAAMLAGRAIENSMLGAAHSMANPLSAHFSLPHGQAVAMALPHVVAFNLEDPKVAQRYAPMLEAAGIDSSASVELVELLWSFLDQSGLPRSSAECGVREADTPQLAREAAGQWTASHNPRPVEAADFEMLYSQLLTGRLKA